MPHLHSLLGQMHADLSQKVDRSFQLLEEHTKKFNDLISDLANRRLNISLQLSPDSSSTVTATTQFVAPSTAPADPSSAVPAASSAPLTHDLTTPATTSSLPASPPRTPNYIIASGVVMIHDHWREWHYGLSGGPAIQNLELQWGTAWRNNQGKKFNRRRWVIEGIKEFIELHALQQQTALGVEMIEFWRQHPKREWCSGGIIEAKSLHWMGENKDLWKDVEKPPM